MYFLVLSLRQYFRFQRILEILEFLIKVAHFQLPVLASLIAAPGSGGGDTADHKQDRYHQGNDLGQKHAVFG